MKVSDEKSTIRHNTGYFLPISINLRLILIKFEILKVTTEHAR